MDIKPCIDFFERFKEKKISHRYITNRHIEPLVENFNDKVEVDQIGESVLKKSIYKITIGTGTKRVLMWSQMHGNESTTTKAVFDLLNTLQNSNNDGIKNILSECTISVIPILNPDGAEAYTRVNFNSVDLNRDAQNLSQPESKILRNLFNSFKPDYCYNLHGQRTIFSAGKSNKSAIVSFLAPAQDEACSITSNRKIAMEIIVHMNKVLQQDIPGHIGVYDDAFNLNCVGDTFQNANIPTILFEAGHFPNDYAREETRKYIYVALCSSLDYIATNAVTGDCFQPYLKIPENEKLFMDVIIRNAKIQSDGAVSDLGIQYQEVLRAGKIDFIPKFEKFDNLSNYYGHNEIDAKNSLVWTDYEVPIAINGENDFVILNNEKISLLPK